MRELKSGLEHKYTRVFADENYNGNAPCSYIVCERENTMLNKPLGELHFQNGPIGEVGINGVMDENLIAIVIDRLEHFQQSEFKCRENALAITHLEEALLWMKKRTLDRELRGVEGTHKV